MDIIHCHTIFFKTNNILTIYILIIVKEKFNNIHMLWMAMQITFSPSLSPVHLFLSLPYPSVSLLSLSLSLSLSPSLLRSLLFFPPCLMKTVNPHASQYYLVWSAFDCSYKTGIVSTSCNVTPAILWHFALGLCKGSAVDQCWQAPSKSCTIILVDRALVVTTLV